MNPASEERDLLSLAGRIEAAASGIRS
jgi:hypothetical protein